jgi:glycine cleavage system T protein
MGKGKAMKRSTLYPLHQALGATFATAGEWELPRHFGDLHAEYQALRHGVGLCDVSYRGLVRVTGRERQRFLHAMVSNDTQSLQPGQGCYATFLNVKGHLIADFVVYAEADAYLLELEPQAVRPFIAAIEYFVISEDVTFHDESGHWGMVALQGPRAATLLARAAGQEVPALPMYASMTCQLAGHAVCCIQRSYTGELGYLLLAPPAALPEVWNAIWAHREGCEVRAVGLEALDVARIEAGIPVYGRDMTEATIPVEANLDAALSYTKGCYVGQEVIARIEARGHVNRKLAGLLLDGAQLPEPGATIVSPQREVGWITSSAYSPACQQNIALGYVRREVLTPGTHLEVRTQDGMLKATVAALPFATRQG